MGNAFGSEYNLEEHGQAGREMYDEYIASEDKFLDLTSKVVAITGTSTNSIGFHIAEVAIRKNQSLDALQPRFFFLQEGNRRSASLGEGVRIAYRNRNGGL